MKKPVRRLGRGLDALVPTLKKDLGAILEESGVSLVDLEPQTTVQPESQQKGASKVELRPNEQRTASGLATHFALVPIGDLSPNPLQPRRTFEDSGIRGLTESIRRSGMLQPITARRTPTRLEIIAGERRWRAAKLAGLSEVPVIFRQATEDQMLEFALIENLQREDLNPIDRAEGYRQFCDRFDLRPEDVAEKVGEDRTTITNYLRLLELPDAIRKLVAGGKILMGHARSLVGLSDYEKREQLAAAIVKNDLSVRALEDLIRKEKAESKKSGGLTKGSPHVRELQRKFEDALKTRVAILEGKKKGSGKLIIDFYNLNDFDRIARLLGIRLD